ncbi:MAG: UDP-N-acetylmuramate dehydrogenase [Acidobacteriales bacterium]|nr:UDP-N-acetylmuramate dehydrogenase [Terriglobales bacterium]
MKLQENIPLAPLTTFKVGGPARHFLDAHSEEEVRAGVIWAREHSVPFFVLGGGSNLVVSDAGFPGLVLRIALRGSTHRDDGKRRLFDVAGGEDWDTFVAATVTENCAGIECLSGIPGTVGGTPVQNVGAYGQEVADCITSVRVFDHTKNTTAELANPDLGFTYRTSIFNTAQRGRYIVLRVTFALTPGGTPHLEYADLKKFFAGKAAPTLSETREAVRRIRHSKAMLIVPDDPDCRSAGSFFKNPIVPAAKYEEVSEIARKRGIRADVPNFPAARNGHVKLSAAWLVEQSGFHKGLSRGPVGISSKHALAIVNRGGAKAADIIALKNTVQQQVADQFGINLQPEPVFVGFEP